MNWHKKLLHVLLDSCILCNPQKRVCDVLRCVDSMCSIHIDQTEVSEESTHNLAAKR